MPSAVIVSKRGGSFVIPKILLNLRLRHIHVSEEDGNACARTCKNLADGRQ
jgi:hypothetical protein